MKKIIFLLLLCASLVGCDKTTMYPSITGQIKQIISPVTTPGYDNLSVVLIFSDGRGYAFRGQCPTLIEEGKVFKIFYSTHSLNNGDYHYANFVDVQPVSYEPLPPPPVKSEKGDPQ